ncbi:hypothetical protein C0989_001806 [Termitomyces sp. Mn162]|nr:hypothetical protein C0989_001806 [Termitomyces sp. Mn162]
MANYLPVLLVSVAANSTPDDSSVATLPRAQVDYLSHNWEEEDVWRSWRNMTRQKNEIANGVRLENASWRTWWKQRNGLGTVTPETLNWLKDSDVTWLYGPLHTAGDWAPPPKPLPSPGLDLTTHKPILKHRSISQLLTSDLTSPVFSPTEPDSEVSYFAHPPPHVVDKPDGSSKPRRPVLPHTKSDTHIARWGSNRAFRKDSPPRIDPPAQPPSPTGIHSPDGYSSCNNQSSDSTTPAPSQRNGQKKRHISFNTFVEQCIAIDKPKKRSGYTEDDEDDDNDVNDDDDDTLHHGVAGRYPYGRNSWGYDDGYEEDADDDESDEDAEAVSLSMWDERFRGNRVSGSDSDSYEDGVGDEEGQADEDEGDGVTDMRSYSRTKLNSPRSQSASSTASSSSSASTSTSMSNSTSPTSESPDHFNPEKQPSHRRYSTSSTSTYRPRFHPSSGSRKRRNAPPLIHTPTSERRSAISPEVQATHVTIAPIAPTILKTGTHGYYGHHHGGWSEGFGDEGGSDDGIWSGASRWLEKSKGKGNVNEESESSGGQTPVELVYVPTLGSNYSFRRKSEQRISVNERERDGEEKKDMKFVNADVMEDHEDGFGNGDQDVYRRRATLFCVGVDDADLDADNADSTVTINRGVHGSAPVPTVVVGPDATHSYERVDVGEDFRSRRSSSSSLSYGRSATIDLYRGRGALPTSPAAREEAMNERERSRSKSRSRSHSRSHSRTPSPAMITDISGDGSQAPASSASDSGPGHTHGPVYIPRRSSSSSIFPASAGSLLSPPPRSRGSQSYQDVGSAQPQQQRGRSNTRTGSSISRERSTGSNSLGSLSPEGWDFGGVTATYTGGRYERDRDRDRSDRERERPRGRERVDGKRLGPGQGHNVSPEGVQDSLLRVSPASTPLPSPATESETPRLSVVTSKTKASGSSVSSSPSCSSNSSTTVVPSHIAIVAGSEAAPLPIPVAVPIDVRTAEECQRNIQPTPSNSPVIHMRQVSTVATVAETTPAFMQESDRFSSQSHPTPTATYTPKIKSPLVVPAVSPAEPSTSYSISPPRSDLSPPSSPLSPTRNEITIVGKAVEMVSSAGAFFGLWNYSA